ncbi:hypothetical protein AMIS_13600 [Actinoplanes missouriensis 431]|uniref:Uncharacterized protein n=1 Tax=Actinoplanes missouriensis (strain ATCC 14538 / DSM 43046 / CBS 188.64 / JCM 3121 / NBRC 102363 / NCIMB 12654 / NRRL B-3342 / UNCC 431) TaxID=512565 RepID=I0H0P3_ACTM4|nr:hypothetical protein [Actinoplanes missouriensis]BAL86580.1 hypothetical protein AMIS_13600 [Actinoplanes missouriensis 431]
MWARHRLEWITALVAAILGVVYLMLPRMGSDLAAQVARADFFAGHGFTPVDLRWYAGVEQFGYSLVSQPVMVLLGVRVTGVLTLVVGSVLLAVLFRRTGAARPWLGAAFGTAGFAGNLVSGRVTYGIGVCFAIAALVLLTVPRLRRLAALAAFLAGASSPVAGLFTGLAGVALMLDRRRRDGLLLAVLAAVPLALISLLFGDGGWMNISRTDTIRAVVTGLVVAALVPIRAVRAGALLSSAGVLAAALVHTPVGLNATRLAVMFGIPVLAAYAIPDAGKKIPDAGKKQHAGILVALLAAMVWWQPPVVIDDVRDIGNPTADPAYFQPLRDRLAAEGLTGRVEIPPTRAYWEAASMGDVPLARGWLRQADIDRNPLFFTTVPGALGTGVELTAASYQQWLDEQAVAFVAVPDAELAWPGRAEARLVTGGLPYLSLVWTDAHWRLYAVTGARPLVTAPAVLVRQDAASVVFDVPAAGSGGTDVLVRVRHHRSLTASGGAAVAAEGRWTRVRVPGPGRYTLSSSLI